jgi:hypothetical protein
MDIGERINIPISVFPEAIMWFRFVSLEILCGMEPAIVEYEREKHDIIAYHYYKVRIYGAYSCVFRTV